MLCKRSMQVCRFPFYALSAFNSLQTFQVCAIMVSGPSHLGKLSMLVAALQPHGLLTKRETLSFQQSQQSQQSKQHLPSTSLHQSFPSLLQPRVPTTLLKSSAATRFHYHSHNYMEQSHMLSLSLNVSCSLRTNPHYSSQVFSSHMVSLLFSSL